jgi:hypothetical protein
MIIGGSFLMKAATYAAIYSTQMLGIFCAERELIQTSKNLCARNQLPTFGGLTMA